jgi:hypothetical protein
MNLTTESNKMAGEWQHVAERETELYDRGVERVTSTWSFHVIQDKRVVKGIVLLIVNTYFYWGYHIIYHDEFILCASLTAVSMFYCRRPNLAVESMAFYIVLGYGFKYLSETDYPEWVISWFSRVPSIKFWDGPSDYITIASFLIASN